MLLNDHSRNRGNLKIVPWSSLVYNFEIDGYTTRIDDRKMNRWEKWYASASSPARCCDIVASLAKESSWGNIAMTSVSEGYARRDCCEVYVVRLANFLSSHTVILFFSLNEEATHVFVSFWLDQEFGNSEPCRDLSEWSGVKSHPICNHRYILNFHSF